MMHVNVNVTARERRLRRLAVTAALLFLVAGGLTPAADADEAALDGRAFDTPEAAGKALVEACAANDDAALLAIFGEAAKELGLRMKAAYDRMRKSGD